MSEGVTQSMLHRTVGASQPERTSAVVDALTDRELEVFRLIGQGMKTALGAEQLHLSVIESYRDRIRAKLDLSDGAELVHAATQWVLENG